MPSSKFNQTPTPTRRPAICSPPIKPPLPIVPLAIPRSLAGFAVWRDLDPLAPHERSEYIDLAKTAPTPTYFGKSPATGFRLEATVTRTADQTYAVTLTIYHQFPGSPESHTWTDVNVPGDRPFDTGLLTDVLIPGQDERLARFME